MDNHLKKPTETNEEYIDRILKLKTEKILDMTWVTISYLIESQTGISRDESTWRRMAKKSMIIDEIDDEIDEFSEIIDEPELDEVSLIQKERYKLYDERTQNRAYLRRIAREETIKEIAHDFAQQMNNKKILYSSSKNVINSNGKNEAILQISDWHYGIDINNYWNTFNPEICKKRVSKLRDVTIDFCKEYKINKLTVVNLSDLIAGRIHSTIRYQSRVDAVTQSMEVGEILAELLSDLMNNGLSIDYYDCLDNHSRLEPNKNDSLDLESLVRIIPWFLKWRLANFPITVHENKYDADIISFNMLNGKYHIAGVHGHKDKPNDVVDNLTLMTNNKYDLILTGHLHHFSCDEKNETVVVSNGSLMGTDDYAKNLRLSSKPSQNLILVNENSVVDLIKRVIL